MGTPQLSTVSAMVGGGFDPSTGFPVDPATGQLMDPATGRPLDPAPGQLVDPVTGLPLDVVTSSAEDWPGWFGQGSPADAARDGQPTLGDLWHRQGWEPGDGLTVTSTSDGAVIHPAGRPAPPVTPVRCTPATRGRTLHIGPGVDLTDVGAFVDTLPVDLRPANYTVAPGVTFGRLS